MKKIIVAIFLLILFNIPAHATKLSSDSATCLRQNDENICIYLGNAKLNNGETNLQAQQITIHKINSGKINKIVASGKHSHYSDVMNDNKKAVSADADLITIYTQKNMMVLDGDSTATVGQDKYSGPHIEYQFK